MISRQRSCMDYRRTGNTIVARLDKGEELLAKLCELAEAEDIGFAFVDGYGDASNVVLTYFDTKDNTEYGESYTAIDYELSVKGVLARKDGKHITDLRAVIANPSRGFTNPAKRVFGSVTGFASGGMVWSAVISTHCVLRLDVVDIDASLAESEFPGVDKLVLGEE